MSFEQCCDKEPVVFVSHRVIGRGFDVVGGREGYCAECAAQKIEQLREIYAQLLHKYEPEDPIEDEDSVEVVPEEELRDGEGE